MNIIAYTLINLVLFFSWYILLFRKRDRLCFADRFIGVFILGLTQIIATEMLLGVVFGKLYPLPLFLLNMVLSFCVLVLAYRAEGTRGLFKEMRGEASRVLGILKGDRILFCIFGLFMLSVLWQVFLGYLFPVYAWDALYYHLPMVGQIMQSGMIQENPTPSFIQQYINIFSKNINLFFLWNIIFLKSDRIVDLSQLFFILAGVVTIYSIALKLGVKEKYAIYSALLFFFAPIIILQSTVNYVDGAVSMLFLITVNFLLYDSLGNYTDENQEIKPYRERRIPLLLSGLAAGILLGSKPTGPLFFAVLLGAILMQELLKHSTVSASKRHMSGEALRTCLVYFVAPALLTGGFWYMRNWIFYGNPLYYMDVSFINITLFEGLKKDWVEPAPAIIDNLSYMKRLLYVWLEKVEYYLYDSRLSGFGPLWFILFLPSMVFALGYAVTKKNYNFLVICLILAITFIVHPRNWTTRYVIFILGLGALSFGLVIDFFQKRENILRVIAVLLALYTLFTANSPCIMPAKIKEFLSLPANERTLSRLKPMNIDTRVRNEYGYWIWIDNNISRGDTLVHTFVDTSLDTARPFFLTPLWNRSFSNNVIYIKSDQYKEWLKKLNENDATYVLLRKNSREDAWIEKERALYYSLRWMGHITEKFTVVYADDNYKIVRFKRD